MRQCLSADPFVHSASASLPSKRHLPAIDPMGGIIVFRGAKLDVLIRTTIRKGLLYPFLEPLGEFCQVFVGIEPGTLQLLWLWVEPSARKRSV